MFRKLKTSSTPGGCPKVVQKVQSFFPDILSFSSYFHKFHDDNINLSWIILIFRKKLLKSCTEIFKETYVFEMFRWRQWISCMKKCVFPQEINIFQWILASIWAHTRSTLSLLLTLSRFFFSIQARFFIKSEGQKIYAEVIFPGENALFHQLPMRYL